MKSTPPVAMTIAGTDSGGGAGIAADLRTFAAHRVHGTFAVAAVTAQSTTEVRRVEVMSSSLLRVQVETVTDDFNVSAAKTGMLADRTIVEAVIDVLPSLGPLVVDPVMVASTGRQLMDADVITPLIPHATIVTPNMFEAALLSGLPVESVDGMERAARAIVDSGVHACLVTGGHLASRAGRAGDTAEADELVDVLCVNGEVTHFCHGRVDSRNVHGSGCTLAAAVAARLARGHSLGDAVRLAVDYVGAAIRGSAEWRVGRGHGPLDHLAPRALEIAAS